jgi:hypothetical protein
MLEKESASASFENNQGRETFERGIHETTRRGMTLSLPFYLHLALSEPR